MKQLPTVHLPSADVSAWRSLIQHRRSLVARRTMTKNRIRAILRSFALRCPHRSLWTRKGRIWLDRLEFDEARTLMMTMLRSDLEIVDSQLGQVEAQLDAIAELLSTERIAMWSVFFLVPVGRGVEEERIRPEEYEVAFAKLWHHARHQPYGVKTTEAPHYRRYVLRAGGDPLAGPGRDAARRGHRGPLGITDGKGVMFVSHRGEIYPAGFLPLCCGRFPQDSVVDVYQNHPTFRALQDPDRLKGNCGICEYRYVCGGSRARAYAVTGDPLAGEPDCVYEPGQDPIPNP